MPDSILLEGVRQNNLQNLSVDIPMHQIVVVTGVSGSGKSSLAFDTIYAEGQRRYVETFSAYTRQFLDRMDRPSVDRVEGIPPAIAIDQTNPVRTSRSTVGTMTEINDHLKLLYARFAQLYCYRCGRPVSRDRPEGVYEHLAEELPAGRRILLTFDVPIPERFEPKEIRELLEKQGYSRFLGEDSNRITVVADRVKFSTSRRQRIIENLERAFAEGQGKIAVRLVGEDGAVQEVRRFSNHLHCAFCDIDYPEPKQNMFSFNSPMGACETCRGFGRVIGIDYDLVVPDKRLSLREGALRPFQSKSYSEVQNDLERFAARADVRLDVPWQDLSEREREWVIEGEGEWDKGVWYGTRRFFEWLESRSYKMHIRVLLSRYRAYSLCPACEGARLKPQAGYWRLHSETHAEGLNISQLLGLPVSATQAFFESIHLSAAGDEVRDVLLSEIESRLSYLVEVGLGYLTLDRQSRTLSGGEVQRINLTTALGTSLVNTLFILDEPSIGLHSRDIGRLIGVLERLRDAGNSLVVVEHDPEVIAAADTIIDIGPEAGERGGRIVFQGRPRDLLGRRDSLTADFLSGRKSVSGEVADLNLQEANEASGDIVLRGARAHNLKGFDVRFPLNRLVTVTGVSGAGKSTLIEETLYRGLLGRMGLPTEQAGKHDTIDGWEEVEQLVLIDQAPIGKTTRSNPASYVGAFDEIRRIFAEAPLSRERGYTAGTFSFNTGDGRCPTCKGNGFEHVEMQFLSDVYIRCPDCGGTRYRSEVLEVKVVPQAGAKPLSIADCLNLTVDEACALFASDGRIAANLKPLRDVGLGYLRLGQPVPTLSGGEAQRLKIAGQLAASGKLSDGRMLFLLDEPTTGLHFADIAVLVGALRRLVEAGNSVLVIEHNLDVIAASDWLVDLGPEGGEAGGYLEFEGTPRELSERRGNHTGEALRAYFETRHRGIAPREAAEAPRSSGDDVVIHRAREHNLRDIDLLIPRDSFTVLTGVSGSGKSTVAFDILFSEGQRRYLESLNAYARQFVEPPPRPDVDKVAGVPPTVAIEQRTTRGGYKSTVATVTEVYHFIRLLFLRTGIQYCPDDQIPIEPQSLESILDHIRRELAGTDIQVLAPMVTNRKGIYRELADWARSRGYAELRVDGALLPTDAWPDLDRYKEHSIDLPLGNLVVSEKESARLGELLRAALDLGNGTVRVVPTGSEERVYSTERACRACGRSFEEPDPRLFSFNSKHGWCPRCQGTGLRRLSEDEEDEVYTGVGRRADPGLEPCPDCGGKRLNEEALAVRVGDYSIDYFVSQSVSGARTAFRALELDDRAARIASDLLAELDTRLAFLEEVGLGYLPLDRAAPTLSGGEAQRIRLSAQLGSNLRGVCYILDEPTIGLHPRDNRMLIDTLKRLQKKGNTIVVVEHDEDTIRSADHIIDLGPGGGVRGGNLVCAGTIEELLSSPDSLTGRYLRTPLAHPLSDRGRADETEADSGSHAAVAAEVRESTRADASGRKSPEGHSAQAIRLRGARIHNLKDIDLDLPLGSLVCVTGVSGSGKSSLVRDVLFENLRSVVGKRKSKKPRFRHVRSLSGWEVLQAIREVDQTPIGKTPRSCPATYVGFFDRIRKLFAGLPESRVRGYDAGRFSFNTSGGRCEVCLGHGVRRIEMSFLPDVTVRCEACEGKRFNDETLDITYRGKSIAEVLEMSIEESVEFFHAHPAILRGVTLLRDVGLGYLALGQPSPTLSGGEAQRVKLVTELSKTTGPGRRRAERGSGGCLYVLDEPTVGLHMADVEELIRVLRRLVNAGNTVVVIEHNLDLIAEADWIIDLGPDGGEGGGRVVASGTPVEIGRYPESETGRFLSELLARQAKDVSRE